MAPLALAEAGVERRRSVVACAAGIAGRDIFHRNRIGTGNRFEQLHMTRLARESDTMHPVWEDGRWQ